MKRRKRRRGASFVAQRVSKPAAMEQEYRDVKRWGCR